MDPGLGVELNGKVAREHAREREPFFGEQQHGAREQHSSGLVSHKFDGIGFV